MDPRKLMAGTWKYLLEKEKELPMFGFHVKWSKLSNIFGVKPPTPRDQRTVYLLTCLAAGWTMFEAIPNYQTFGMCSDNFSRTPKKPIRTRSNLFGHVPAQHWVRVSVTVRTRTRSKRVQKPFGTRSVFHAISPSSALWI